MNDTPTMFDVGIFTFVLNHLGFGKWAAKVYRRNCKECYGYVQYADGRIVTTGTCRELIQHIQYAYTGVETRTVTLQ